MSIPRYIEHITFERKYSTHTQLAYSRDLQSFQQFCQETFEEQDIDQLPYTIIRSWIIALVDQGKSNRTVNRKISVLRSYYNFLLRTEIITVSPLRKHMPLKETKKVHIPFSEKEMAALLEGNHFEDSYKGVLQKTIIELLYSTGMRRAELIALKSSDVSFDTATLRVLGKRNGAKALPDNTYQPLPLTNLNMRAVFDLLSVVLLFHSRTPATCPEFARGDFRAFSWSL